MGQIANKSQKLFQISASILVLEMRKGHLAWKVTDLVKKSGVSRSTIYSYFGSDKEKMCAQALDIFVDRFYGFDSSPKPQKLSVMVGRARQYVIDFPETALFYQKTRMNESKFAESFKTIELRFRNKLAQNFPLFSAEQLQMLHVFIHGMVTAPFLSPEESARICDTFMKTWSAEIQNQKEKL